MRTGFQTMFSDSSQVKRPSRVLEPVIGMMVTLAKPTVQEYIYREFNNVHYDSFQIQKPHLETAG
jgi:hypothetical protein